MTINGTPLHPLVIHAAVFFTPLAALAVIAFVLVGRWRASLRLPAATLAVLAGGSIVAAYLTGRSLLDDNPRLGSNPLVHEHEERAGQLLWVGLVFAVVAVAAVLMAAVPARRDSTTGDRAAVVPVVARVLGGAAVLLGVATLVLVVLVGDLGARAVWGGHGLF